MKKTLLKKFFVLAAVVVMLFCNMITAHAADFDFETAVKSAIYIETDRAVGSGFAIDKHYIMTNAHVIKGAKRIYIGLYDADSEYYNIGETSKAKLVCADYDMDVAILYVEDIELVPVKIGDVSKIKVGNEVFAIGAPEGLTFTLTKGIISATNRMFEGYKHIQIDATITHGNSGGPLFNSKGEVIGINSSGYEGENLNFAISIDIATEYAKKQVRGLKLQYASDDEVTPSPEITKAPEKTAAPEATAEPEETKAPAKTDAPKKTKAPDEEKASDPKTEKNDESEEQEQENVKLESGVITVIVAGVVLVLGIAATIIIIIAKNSGKKDDDNDFFDSEQIEEQKEEQIEEEQAAEPVVAPIVKAQASAKIKILNGTLGGTEYEIFDGQTLNIGKDAHFAHIVIDKEYQAVSRKHLTVTFKNDTFYVTDVSSNGTYYANGQRFASNIAVEVKRDTLIKLADDSCQIKLK